MEGVTSDSVERAAESRREEIPVDLCSAVSLDAFSIPTREAVRGPGGTFELVGLDTRAFKIVWRGIESAECKFLRWLRKDGAGARETNGGLGSDAANSRREGSGSFAGCGVLVLPSVIRLWDFVWSSFCAGSCWSPKSGANESPAGVEALSEGKD